MNVADPVRKSARGWGLRPALRQGAVAFSDHELEASVTAVAAGHPGARPQLCNRKGIWSLNRPEVVIALFACHAARIGSGQSKRLTPSRRCVPDAKSLGEPRDAEPLGC